MLVISIPQKGGSDLKINPYFTILFGVKDVSGGLFPWTTNVRYTEALCGSDLESKS